MGLIAFIKSKMQRSKEEQEDSSAMIPPELLSSYRVKLKAHVPQESMELIEVIITNAYLRGKNTALDKVLRKLRSRTLN